ncbi:MAG: FAD-dependent oxidoreductase [Novosphingobium sp.]|nr:FAD-dependent oxidoreductase [Novosphingobium sp.]
MTAHPKYPNVFRPIRLGPVEIPNRFYMSPHVQPMTTARRAPTQDVIRYFEERIRGGCRLIMLSMTIPTRVNSVQPAPDDVGNIPALRALSDAIHAAGGKIFAELFYWWGRSGSWQPLSPPAPSMGPSMVQFQHLGKGMTTREMTHGEIDRMVEVYGKSAANLRQAGFDGIMLHAAHGAQIEHFMSPYFNRRDDAYGGSFENRMRFPGRVFEAVRQYVSDSMAVGMRLNCDELLSGGYSTDEARRIVAHFAGSGAIDFVDLDIAIEPNQFHLGMAPVFVEEHAYIPYVRAVRDGAGGVPVLSVLGRLTSVADGEKALAEGLCDMVGAARAWIAEPNLVQNAHDGLEDRGRTCIACNWCMSSLVEGAQTCTINPAAWRERYWGHGSITPATKPCRVVIVGAGPGGLEAARVSAMRGHDVTLIEASERLGGALALWSELPGRQTYAMAIDWWAAELAGLGVDIRLGTTATAGSILSEKPDAVILATGAQYNAEGQSHFSDQPIEGHDRSIVCRPEDILLGKVRSTGKVVVLDAEGMHTGAGVAEVLAKAGADVELLTPYPSPLSARVDAQFETRFIMKSMKEAGVRISPSTYIRRITESAVTAYDVDTGQDRSIADVAAVVLSTGRVSVNALEKQLEGKVTQLFAIGDAAAARVWAAASFEGHKFARYIGEPGAPSTIGDVYFDDTDPELAPVPAVAS